MQTAAVASTLDGIAGLGVTDWLDILWLQHWLQRSSAPDIAKADTSAIASEPARPRRPDAQSIGPADPSEGTASSASQSGAVYPKGNWVPSGARRASWVQFRAARAHLETRPLARALRPVGRRRHSLDRQLLDEDATAETVASTGLPIPRWMPASEPWFDLLLLIDDLRHPAAVARPDHRGRAVASAAEPVALIPDSTTDRHARRHVCSTGSTTCAPPCQFVCAGARHSFWC